MKNLVRLWILLSSLVGLRPMARDLSNLPEIALLMAYDEMGQECEAGGNLDAALFWYTLGMKTHCSFYECRFVRFNLRDRKDLENKLKERRPFPRRATPWSRELARPGSAVYVYAEEGFGDTIQFCRYLSALARDGYQILFRPQPALVKLMSHSFSGIEVVNAELPEEWLHFDTYVPLLSLPHHYLTKVEALPASEGYLHADAALAEQYREEYFQGDAFKVGIVWQGCPERFNDRQRSVRLTDLLPLAEVEGVQLYALQVGVGREQLSEIAHSASVIDLGPALGDFAQTAAAIVNLDLLISIDTSVAHLGGALGHPTWILIPYVCDWRWFRKGDQSPWYKSALLFRQERENDWAPTIDRLKGRLKEAVAARSTVS
jgi:hypothetical protein